VRIAPATKLDTRRRQFITNLPLRLARHAAAALQFDENIPRPLDAPEMTTVRCMNTPIADDVANISSKAFFENVESEDSHKSRTMI
jgi:hypothetical protein